MMAESALLLRELRCVSPNLMGRATLVNGSGDGLDVERASDGRFPAEPQSLFAHWDEFRQWAAAQDGRAELAVDPADLRAPTPFPRQVFAIGLNYRSHAAESGLAVPPVPAVFTKFPTCVANPDETVALPSAYVDWEVELVVAIGRRAQAVAEQEAWQHVAGLMIGQDLSERLVQLTGPVPQFSLGKSYPGFGPVGPVLVTPDEFADPNDLELGYRLGDEDLIFTGTPAGVGGARDPKRFLEPGGLLVSHVAGIGELHSRLVAGSSYRPPK